VAEILGRADTGRGPLAGIPDHTYMPRS